MISNSQLEELIHWLHIIGIITIAGGALQAIPGFFAMGIGALPGLLAVYIGTRLFAARDRGREILATQNASPALLGELFGSLALYFKLQAALLAIGAVTALIGLISLGLATRHLWAYFL